MDKRKYLLLPSTIYYQEFSRKNLGQKKVFTAPFNNLLSRIFQEEPWTKESIYCSLQQFIIKNFKTLNKLTMESFHKTTHNQSRPLKHMYRGEVLQALNRYKIKS